MPCHAMSWFLVLFEFSPGENYVVRVYFKMSSQSWCIQAVHMVPLQVHVLVAKLQYICLALLVGTLDLSHAVCR